ncbi:MAG: imidazolonepropionase [Phycisphaerales bacterium]|nr:imidazolonepropionase [Phycisphaerales bacterium]
MSPPPLLIRNARVLTLAGPSPRRGPTMNDLGVLPRADVLIEGERIAGVSLGGVGSESRPIQIDADGRVLMPGFIDCHTHLCWAGDRLDEWDMRRRGAAYLDILKAGGGIMSTVRAVRAASREQLTALLRERLDQLLREGTTTAEVKTGYGLTAEHELKMLRAVRDAAEDWPGTVVATALLGHAVDPNVPGFVERTIKETLPAVHAEFPAIAVDAFCEEGAWSRDECVRLLEAAGALGHPVRVHADQFHTLGMTEAAVALGALSVDHLEAASPSGAAALAASDTIGVILPCCGFHVDGRYAGGRALIDAGAALAVATNCNPGSAPCSSIPMAVALAVRHCGLTPAEAITACTVNAAAVLGFTDRGRIEAGKRADLVLLRHRDERLLAHDFGGNPVDAVVCGGVLHWQSEHRVR